MNINPIASMIFILQGSEEDAWNKKLCLISTRYIEYHHIYKVSTTLHIYTCILWSLHVSRTRKGQFMSLHFDTYRSYNTCILPRFTLESIGWGRCFVIHLAYWNCLASAERYCTLEMPISSASPKGILNG